MMMKELKKLKELRLSWEKFWNGYKKSLAEMINLHLCLNPYFFQITYRSHERNIWIEVTSKIKYQFFKKSMTLHALLLSILSNICSNVWCIFYNELADFFVLILPIFWNMERIMSFFFCSASLVSFYSLWDVISCKSWWKGWNVSFF